MSAIIQSVSSGSPAEREGISAGGRLLAVNGKPVKDFLDYGFLCAGTDTVLDIEYGGELCRYSVHKGDEYEDIGLTFDSFLMDESHHCRNNCIFCFIDQLPKGLREPLYFKDDDERLSYLFGNYITLTNLDDADVERIIEMHISPVNISVHTTDPELRCRMMRNRFAGEKLKYLYRLAEAGIEINCQIVLCRDWNDGEKLRSSLKDLAALWPSVRSVAVVPVGLTDHRDGLEKLKPFDSHSAGETIDIIDEIADECEKNYGIRMLYPADEFFLMSGRGIPALDYYGELLQLENGVGMLALFESDFRRELDASRRIVLRRHRVDIATGAAAAPTIERLANEVNKKYHNITVTVHTICNEFFGERITVSGLVTGRDLISQLKGKLNSEHLLIPSNMLRREGDIFLDDITPAQAEYELKAKITPCDDASALLAGIFSR